MFLLHDLFFCVQNGKKKKDEEIRKEKYKENSENYFPLFKFFLRGTQGQTS